MYGRLVHIRTLGFEKNKVYFATQQEFETLMLEMAENGI